MVRPVGVPELPQEVVQILRDLNPWWEKRPAKPAPLYLRRGVARILDRLSRPEGLIEVLRGPRQVGKTTIIAQAIDRMLDRGVPASDILFVRFDQEVLRESKGGLVPIVRWFERRVRDRPFNAGRTAHVFLDEVHKLEGWDEDVKFLFDTFRLRLLVTGSSSVLVARGGRESLAGRAITTEFPTFQFREVLEAWEDIAARLPQARPFAALLQEGPVALFEPYRTLKAQQRLSLQRLLDRYYSRGGYPRLHNGEVPDDQWADYLTQTIIDRVLGVDVPDLFPIQNPKLLRWIYVEVARSTGHEISQNRLTDWARDQGFGASQPLVGKYLHCLADALLIREFRRYPLGKKASSRAPSKITLTDLGARNALFRGAPSLWESPPEHVGPLVETLAQSVIRDPNLQVHFFRDHEKPGDRRTPVREVDFVAETLDGTVMPIEIKFRRRIEPRDSQGLRLFLERYKAPHGIMVTRDDYGWDAASRILRVPLLDFLLAF